jgi:hypothetical protein
MVQRISVLTLFLFFCSCNENSNLKKLEWMIGNWVCYTDMGTFHESWIKKDDHNFEGKGCFIVKGDTVFSEGLAVRSRNGGVYYVATIASQNEGQPVEFMLTTVGKELVFENYSHDFPKRIIYQYHDDDHISATLMGVEKGVPRTEELRFMKQKPIQQKNDGVRKSRGHGKHK